MAKPTPEKQTQRFERIYRRSQAPAMQSVMGAAEYFDRRKSYQFKFTAAADRILRRSLFLTVPA